MFGFLYQLIQLCGVLVYTPKLLKKGVFWSYLGWKLPKKSDKQGPSFLLYAVSVGETRALLPLFAKLKETYPTASFYIASRTQTGHMEAKKEMAQADAHFVLPFDFCWLSRFLLKRFAVDVLVIMEGDLWYYLLKEAKKRDALVLLISGKISERSYRRFKRFPKIAKKIFSLFDCIAAQNEQCQKRFIELGANPQSTWVTGNIKMSQKLSLPANNSLFASKLGLEEGDFVIVAGSTHAREEKAILESLTPLLQMHAQVKLLFVPRHPERFEEVAMLLQAAPFPFARFSALPESSQKSRVFLIDAMGLLVTLYSIADLALTCGSFVKEGKGHNILEPIQAHTPVLFGPYMESQQDLVELVLSSKSGLQLSLNDLPCTIDQLIQNPSSLQDLHIQGEHFLHQLDRSFDKTWNVLHDLISLKVKGL